MHNILLKTLKKKKIDTWFIKHACLINKRDQTNEGDERDTYEKHIKIVCHSKGTKWPIEGRIKNSVNTLIKTCVKTVCPKITSFC